MKKVLLFGGIGLVGRHIHKVLKESYDVVITSKNQEVENGYKVDIEDIEFSMKIVKEENPDIVISSLGGNYEAQLKFHEKLANWIKENNKKICFRGVTKEVIEIFQKNYSDKFEYIEERDLFDYVYDGESLRTLAGRKNQNQHN